MSDFIKFLSGGSWQAVVAMVLIVLVVAAIVLVLIMAFRQGREVSLWPPKFGPRLSGSESQARAVSAKVISPRSGASVDRGFPVEGTFEKLPDGYELWVATTDGARYWPQTKATTRDDGSWVAKVYYISRGGPSGGGGTFAVFAVGPDGQTLLSQ